MSQIANASYIGKGEIFMGPYAGGAAMVSIGNCSELTFSHATEKKDQLDYTSAGGGKANSLERITGVTMTIKAHDVNAQNLAIGALGSVSAVVSAVVTAEAGIAYKGGLVPLAFVPDMTVAPVVTNTAASTTYVAGTDYILTGAGIYVLTSGSIPDAVASAANIKTTYTKKAVSVVEAMVASAQEYKLIFAGLNEANSGKQVIVRVHRFKPGAAQNIAYIGDDYAALDLPGEALSDSLITGAGLSKFYKTSFA
jgi:phage tail protein X